VPPLQHLPRASPSQLLCLVAIFSLFPPKINSFILLSSRGPPPLIRCDVLFSNLNVWQEVLFMCETWLTIGLGDMTHMSATLLHDMTHSLIHMWHSSFIPSYMTCLIHVWHAWSTRSYVTWRMCRRRCYIKRLIHSFIRDMTHWFYLYGTCLILVWHDLFTHSYMTWRIHVWHTFFHMNDGIRSHVTYDWEWVLRWGVFSFMCDMTHSYMIWLIHMWHNSFICDMTHLYWHDAICIGDMSHWSIICDVTHSCMAWLIRRRRCACLLSHLLCEP